MDLYTYTEKHKHINAFC